MPVGGYQSWRWNRPFSCFMIAIPSPCCFLIQGQSLAAASPPSVSQPSLAWHLINLLCCKCQSFRAFFVGSDNRCCAVAVVSNLSAFAMNLDRRTASLTPLRHERNGSCRRVEENCNFCKSDRKKTQLNFCLKPQDKMFPPPQLFSFYDLRKCIGYLIWKKFHLSGFRFCALSRCFY